MTNLKKLINNHIVTKSFQKSANKKKEDLQYYSNHLTKFTDSPIFEQLISFFIDNKQADFPISFTHKDEYFQKGSTIYKAIMGENYVKKIKIMNSLDCDGKTEINIKVSKVEIIISIASIKLGIGSGGGVNEFTVKQCEESADVLAHELFHARNNIDIINYVGIQEYKSIRYSQKPWTKLAWNIFDEYCAYRKNAELFKSFNSVESVDNTEHILESIQFELKYNDGLKYNDSLDSSLKFMIKDLFYSTATISAFADVSKQKEETLLAESNKSKKIFQEVRCLFNNLYPSIPLNSEKYYDMGCKLEQIYNLHIKGNLN
ncbi:hypothetical protein [Clostridium ljungdahlii]|uniref:Uncharacterized protein n=1 Tax=Clostridium ljungdahlii TaxID=1538 RepID=A0A166RFA0_9CLOT|nr:hypothetical protein [Clostridium ljungdahlii]OAA90764.1 hypothetical protein WY13_01068 [Clostridium ljungdahlii]